MIFRVVIAIFVCLLFSCFPKVYETTLETITAINELQGCEEENVFYRVIEFDTPKKGLNHRDSLVLFVFSDSLDNKGNYDLFFANYDVGKRIKTKVKGHFSRKGTEIFSYGCYGSKKFKVTEIISIEDVTEEMDYQVKYR